MRGQASWGLGRIDDAKAAWKSAAQRFEELDDAKAAASLHARIGHLESRHREAAAQAPVHNHTPAVEAERPV